MQMCQAISPVQFLVRTKVGSRLEWHHLPTSSAGCVPAGHPVSQGSRWIEDPRMHNELQQFPEAPHPACRQVLSHTNG